MSANAASHSLICPHWLCPLCTLQAGRVAGRSSDEAKKWLDWPQYLALVQQLRLECAGVHVVRLQS